MTKLDKVIGGACVIFLSFYAGAFVQELRHLRRKCKNGIDVNIILTRKTENGN